MTEQTDRTPAPVTGSGVERPAPQVPWLVSVVWRHKVLTALCVVATVAAALLVGSVVKPTYQAEGSVQLLSPPNVIIDGKTVAVNPYGRFGQYGEAVMASSVVGILTSQPHGERLDALGISPDRTIVVSPLGGGGIVTVTVIAATEAKALADVQALTDQVRDVVAIRQRIAGAPPRSWIRVSSIAEPSRAQPLSGGRLKTMLAVLALGGLVTLAAAAAADALARRRRRSPAPAAVPAAVPAAAPAGASAGEPAGEPAGELAGGEPAATPAGVPGQGSPLSAAASSAEPDAAGNGRAATRRHRRSVSSSTTRPSG